MTTAEITLCLLFRYSTGILLLLLPKREVCMFNWKRFWPINYKRLYARFQSTAAKESRVCYLFGSNIYCANLHTPKHHLVIEIYIFGLLLGGLGCGSNISPLSTSLKYWLLPSHRGGTTCGSRRIGCPTAQGTCISTCEGFPPTTQLSNTLYLCIFWAGMVRSIVWLGPWWDQEKNAAPLVSNLVISTTLSSSGW